MGASEFTEEEVIKIAQEMVYLYSWFEMEGTWHSPTQLDRWVEKRVKLRLKNGPGQDTLTIIPM